MTHTEKIDEGSQDRIAATVVRLIGNIPRACQVLDDHGYANLAGQLGRDRANLDYWQSNGALVFVEDETTTQKEVYLPLDCAVCNRRRLLFDGENVRCEKCGADADVINEAIK